MSFFLFDTLPALRDGRRVHPIGPRLIVVGGEGEFIVSGFYQQTRFTGVFCASVVMLASYPYFHDTATGAALGGITALLLLGTGVYAVGACRKTVIVAGALALFALCNSIYSLLVQSRGSIWTEASFTAFYIFITIAIFSEVIRSRGFQRDSILGIVSVYLLIGITFGSLYDLVETIEPGSFRLNFYGTDDAVGFRRLLFFSFMTLTSIGYGDITPATDQAQSLAILEGVAGVLYVACLVARVVNAYRNLD